LTGLFRDPVQHFELPAGQDNGGLLVGSDLSSESFGEFVAAALPGLLRFGHLLTGDPREAEDLVQEALARSLRRWRTVQANDAGPYVRRTMVNTHITRWRRWDARVRLGALPDGGADDPALRRTDDWDRLRRALAQLPVRQRTVLVLRYYEDLPDARIAQLMGCAPGTVRSQAARGLAALRPLLEPEGVREGANDER
jgi:RNA polymerase sigma-70 factor (sigma-E family)